MNRPFVFVSRCPRCGAALDRVTVVETWREAEAWCYLAAVAHRAVCPARRPRRP